MFDKSFILDVWHGPEYASEWDLKQEKKGNNYFPGWKLCLAYSYYFHWFQAGYAYKRYAYKKNILNKREERSNNVGKTVVTFPHIFCEMLGALVRLIGITKA